MNKLPLWKHEQAHIDNCIKQGFKYTPHETWLRGLYLYNARLHMNEKYKSGDDNNCSVAFWGQQETPYWYMLLIIKFKRKQRDAGRI